jgi:hypothetical protein
MRQSLAEPTDKQIDRALRDYGPDPKAPAYAVFASEIAAGNSKRDAYLAIRPDASPHTASVQGARLLHHPKIAALVEAQKLGAQNIVRALAPSGVEQLAHLMLESSNDRVRLDAANSILDRGGVPKTAQLAMDARLSISDALAGVIGDGSEEPPELPVLEGPRAFSADS